MEKFNWMNELNVQTTAAVQTTAKFGKLVSSAERVEETAQLVADAMKYVSFMSTVFQLVVIFARIVSMYVEVNRGTRELPTAFCRIVILLGYV